MKRKFQLGLVLVTILICITGMNVLASSEFDFEFHASTGAITSYRGSGGDVVIPSKIGGVDVTSIGEGAFYEYSSLTSIIIPDSVTSIGDIAFRSCTGLTSITIPNSVTSIGHSAFKLCTNLTSIIIPDSVTSIGDNAFRSCSSLTNIKIPDNVTSIGEHVFRSCSSLTNIKIPYKVTSIGEHAFGSCISLTSITIPNSVTSIEYSAFYNCSSLTSIIIPDSVTSIGDYAFYGCNDLTIYGYGGSYAQTYAQENNKPFKILINVILDNKKLVFDVPPTIISGRTLVPLRKIFETLGANVEWHGATRTVTATKGTTIIEVKIDNTITKVNDKIVEIDVPAAIINGRILVPIRFISESFGYKVDWNGDPKTVIIES